MPDSPVESTRLAVPPRAFTVVRLLTLFWAVAIAAPALLVLLTADSWRGQLFGYTALLTAFVPFSVAAAWEKRSRSWTIAAKSSTALWLVMAVSVCALAPAGPPNGGRVGSQRSSATAHGKFSRFALSNLLPEEDQLLAGFTLMSFVDPLLSPSQASELKGLTRQLYRELERDPQFWELGSAMGGTYEALFFGPSPSEQCYTYVPASVDRSQPAPVLIFFHGNGGNFKAYLWILSKLADRAGVVVVAPTGGVGNWSERESEPALKCALEAAGHVAAIDLHRVHLAGLSNGGRAVSQLAARHGSDFASIIFISPVFDSDAVSAPEFAAYCRGRPIVVLTGARDNRVPLDYVSERVARLKTVGVTVGLRTFEDADHFLIFSHRDALVALLTEWVGHAMPARD